MEVVNSTSSASASSFTSSINSSNEMLGKDDFLKLMVAQLQNQDPLKPMANEDFVLQLTQLSTMEQLQNVSGAMEQMSEVGQMASASSLIGKEVTYVGSSGELVAGMVDALKLVNGKIHLVIGEEEVALTDISTVQEMTPTSTQEGAAAS